MQRTVIAWCLLLAGVVAGDEAPAGLRLELTVDGQSTVRVAPNVQLFVPGGASASPLLPPGRTVAEWTGYINADLRGDYRFKADASGPLKLEINGKVVIEGDGSKPSREVRLNKGPNRLRVGFETADGKDSYLRLWWSEFGFLWEPIHRSLLTRDAEDAGLLRSQSVLRGRELFLEGRCARCHAVDGSGGVPELAMDAPAFDGIGSRRRAAWMAEWIRDPKAQRATARMPRMVHGVRATESARAMAAYLGSLKDGNTGVTGEPEAESEAEYLTEVFHCVGCHILPGSGEKDPTRIALDGVNAKFPPGQLAAFLLKPTKHYRWRRMPDFRMSKEEAVTLAAYLRAKAPVVEAGAEQPGAKLIARGKELVRSSGCLNCHVLTGASSGLKARALKELKPSARGCLADEATGRSPFYAFSPGERGDLMAFLASDRESLYRHVPVEFAERQTRNLRCAACHGQLEGFPPLERLGGQLKPEFMAQIIGGKLDYSPRPWLEKVMPAFSVYAPDLAAGLAHSHGYSHVTPKEGPIDMEAAKVGRQLTGVSGGFSCISCHGVGDLQPTQVFEAEGINLSLPARRLQKDYFIRWLLNPLKIEPQTKMPVYFDEQGNSPLFNVYEGNTMKQLEAFWQYLRTGDDIDPPKLEGF